MPTAQNSRRRAPRLRAGVNVFRRPSVLLGFAILVLAAFILASLVIRLADGAEPDPTAKVPSTDAPDAKKKDAEKKGECRKKKEDRYAWKNLFDGKTLKGWKAPKFGGEGKVEVKNGAIILNVGESMTGITYTGKVPRTNFEIELEGQRLDGVDFFATTTFPVGDKCVSLVTGGWGGTVVGISCVDFYDASDNMTSNFLDFKNKKWYKFRIRVSDAKIECWVDKEQVVDLPRKGHKFDIRDEVDLCRPLGISSWCSTGAVRNIRLRLLKPEEVKAAAKAVKEQEY